ncbi:asparagine synthase (glutamine-hydrolyzing) [Catellatospora sp. KI3]|uniref:asparagine synthase (glutamine-hydrolyzing) n=1 Tax=Catellatospora sp. KI3 TaxID=3041620 RepID=UPI00248242B0|nr:asparagine synthase (glutamine-hydrolyzing) [Catellatospora sp. KI3]MDI1461047.1 asparagine synthase (glutamine-hydrolyzing) [Catellatospora sp. KI3]
MCGITGLVAWWQSPTRNQVVVTAMTDTMHHRGPDGHGIWSTDHVCLGHTRLAVVDIATGTQPMVVRRPGGGEVAIVFCGELYGYQHLRSQLQAAGQVFTTASDTEVVLRAYLQWGERFVDRLTGMYAIAIWNSDAESLLLVRDRVGIKPLYVAQTATELLFGSEIKALLAHPGVDAEVDADGLAQLLAMVPMTSPGNAVLAGVEELPPGTLLRYDRSGVHRRRYWQLGTVPHQHDRLATVDHVRDLLQRSVREHVDADVPIGALCSGGVDSSAITALAAAALEDPGLLASFDIEHHGAAVASSSFHRGHDHPFAVAAAEHIGSDHHTVRVSTDDLLTAHDRTLHAMDLPSLSAINVSLAVLFAEVGVKRKVVLSGEGADELFRGYTFHEPPPRRPSAGMPWAGAYQPLTHLLRRDVIGQVRPGRYIDQQRRQLLDQLPVPRRRARSGTAAAGGHVADLVAVPAVPPAADRPVEHGRRRRGPGAVPGPPARRIPVGGPAAVAPRQRHGEDDPAAGGHRPTARADRVAAQVRLPRINDGRIPDGAVAACPRSDRDSFLSGAGAGVRADLRCLPGFARRRPVRLDGRPARGLRAGTRRVAAHQPSADPLTTARHAERATATGWLLS